MRLISWRWIRNERSPSRFEFWVPNKMLPTWKMLKGFGKWHTLQKSCALVLDCMRVPCWCVCWWRFAPRYILKKMQQVKKIKRLFWEKKKKSLPAVKHGWIWYTEKLRFILFCQVAARTTIICIQIHFDVQYRLLKKKKYLDSDDFSLRNRLTKSKAANSTHVFFFFSVYFWKCSVFLI